MAPPDLADAAVVDLPLVGEWVALNTPAERVPSHGTDYFGQRYAFDFVKLDAAGRSFATEPLWRQFFGTLPADRFLAWNQPVFAAFAGEVIGVGDGWPDRARVNALWEMVRAHLFARRPEGDDYRRLTGNYVLVAGEPGVALYAHLQRHSIRVAAGARVAAGEQLGAVGNSGNSTMPHLHFQLMDGPDPRTAKGRLCAFRHYRRRNAEEWQPVATGLPGLMERVESLPRDSVPPPLLRTMSPSS